mmetsp:Transcript_10030/g.28204  ORF Transcript_10030/g.28204 Transcript_10030/m.28204 type:complete len:512 (-) Transcript_10030:263-1798(-)
MWLVAVLCLVGVLWVAMISRIKLSVPLEGLFPTKGDMVRPNVDQVALDKDSHRDSRLDWLRSSAIFFVVAIHVLQNIRYATPISDEDNNRVRNFNRFFMQFGLGIFMVVSGASCAHSQDTFGVFLRKRAIRLLLPLVVGYVLFVVPAQTLAPWQPHHHVATSTDTWPSYLWHVISRFNPSWLWFLPALFFISVGNYPFLAWSRPNRPYSPALLVCGMLLSSIAWATVLTIGCSMDRHAQVTAMVAKGIPALKVLLGSGLFFMIYVGAAVVPLGKRAVVIAGSFVLVHYMYWSLPQGRNLLTNLLYSLAYYNLFFVYGILVTEISHYEAGTRTPDPSRPTLGTATKQLAGTVMVVGAIIVGVACLPWDGREAGYTWRFPLYDTEVGTMYFVAGAWCWILVLYNASFHYIPNAGGGGDADASSLPWLDSLARHAGKSVIVVYLMHWLFVVLWLRYTVLPVEKVESLEFLFCYLFFTSVFSCWAAYAVVLNVRPLAIALGISPTPSHTPPAKGA